VRGRFGGSGTGLDRDAARIRDLTGKGPALGNRDGIGNRNGAGIGNRDRARIRDGAGTGDRDRAINSEGEGAADVEHPGQFGLRDAERDGGVGLVEERFPVGVGAGRGAGAQARSASG